MKYQWIGRNVDLRVLREKIESYFKSRKFFVRILRSNDVFELLAIKRVDHLRRKITVKLLGDPNNFEIEFLAGEEARSVQKLDTSLKFFGGGIFVLKALETMEYYQKIEGEFWRYMEITIAESVSSV